MLSNASVTYLEVAHQEERRDSQGVACLWVASQQGDTHMACKQLIAAQYMHVVSSAWIYERVCFARTSHSTAFHA